MKKALISGITGQDGLYLSQFLLEKGYEVHGIVRRAALEDPDHRLWRIRHLLDDIVIHSGSLESFPSLFKIIRKIKPDECYHLAAQSYVSYSFEDEFSTLNTNSAVADSSNVTIHYLDSPATTSSITYKTQVRNRNDSGTITSNLNGSTEMTLMEVSG